MGRLTTIGVIAAKSFPDRDMIREKLKSAGAMPDVQLVIRANDNLLGPIVKELGLENVQVWAPDPGLYGNVVVKQLKKGPKKTVVLVPLATTARDLDMLNKLDYIVLFDDEGSTVTKWWRDKRDVYPYSLMYGSKITTFAVGKAKKRYKKGASKE